MASQIIEDMNSTLPEADSASMPKIRPTCEWNRPKDGADICGKPAIWAIVDCCHNHFVCGPCLAAIYERWSWVELQCKACGTVFTPMLKTIKRVVPL